MSRVMTKEDVVRELERIELQPRCAPGKTDHSLHWVRRGDQFDVWTWHGDTDSWYGGMRMSPQYAYASGWRYHAPAVPPEI